MPYRRKRAPRRRRRTPRGSKTVTYRGLKRYLKKNTELKYHCREELAMAVPNTGVIRTFALIPQGDGANTRDGNVVGAKSLVLRMRMENADTFGNMIRVIIARSRGVTFGLPDFPIGTGALAPLGCWTNLKKNMVILHDRVYKTDADDPNRFIKIQVRVNAKMNYIDGTTNAPQTGDLVMFAVSDSTVAAHPTLSYAGQLSYTDS